MLDTVLSVPTKCRVTLNTFAKLRSKAAVRTSTAWGSLAHALTPSSVPDVLERCWPCLRVPGYHQC